MPPPGPHGRSPVMEDRCSCLHPATFMKKNGVLSAGLGTTSGNGADRAADSIVLLFIYLKTLYCHLLCSSGTSSPPHSPALSRWPEACPNGR